MIVEILKTKKRRWRSSEGAPSGSEKEPSGPSFSTGPSTSLRS